MSAHGYDGTPWHELLVRTRRLAEMATWPAIPDANGWSFGPGRDAWDVGLYIVVESAELNVARRGTTPSAGLVAAHEALCTMLGMSNPALCTGCLRGLGEVRVERLGLTWCSDDCPALPLAALTRSAGGLE